MRYVQAGAIALTALLLGPAALADEAQTGTLGYPAAFFADARPNTAYDMIGRLPGFNFDDGTSARGFAGTAGNVLIDGLRPTSKTDDLQSILVRIPAGDVDRIEVIRGGAPGIDMHGQTVIANVIRKKSDSTRIVAKVSNLIFTDGHMVPGATLQYTHRTGESIYEGSVYLARSYSDGVGVGFYDVTDLTTGTVQHSELHDTGMGLGWGMTGAATIPLWGGQFKANVAYEDTPWHSVYSYFSPGNDWQILDSSGGKSGELGLHWNRKFGSMELETLVLQRLGRDTDINTYDAAAASQLFTLKNQTGESIARAILRYMPDSDLTVEGGAEGAFNYLDGNSTYTVNGVAVPLPAANARVEEKRGEVFAQATWKFAPDWVLEAGARFEYSTIGETRFTDKSRSLFFPKPRAVLTWTPQKNLQVRLRYERVVGQLDFDNFVASSNLASSGVNAGNLDLEPDRHTQYEVSFEYDFWGKGAFVATFLHDEISSVVDYIPVTGASGVFDAPGNIGDGLVNQIRTSLTLPLDKLGLENGLLKVTNDWTFSRVRDPVTGAMRGISGKRPQDIEFTLSQDIESLKSTWSIFYYNCWDEYRYRLTEERHSYVHPPYIDITWDYRPTPQWSLKFSLKNVVPFHYVDTHTRYTGPRDSATPYEFSEFNVTSQRQLYVEIRRTF